MAAQPDLEVQTEFETSGILTSGIETPEGPPNFSKDSGGERTTRYCVGRDFGKDPS
jgi:hypothetical protein